MKSIVDHSKWIVIVILLLGQITFIRAQTSLTQLNPKPHSDLINDIFLTDSSRVYVVGGLGKIAYSDDGGASWNLQYQNPNRTLKSIAFSDNNTGICVGDSGLVLRTIDAGNTWNTVNSGSLFNLNAVSFNNSTSGYIVGNSGTILYTSDAGITWNPQASGTSFDLNAISISASNAGYIAGNYGTVLKTTNGTTWAYAANAGTNNLLALYQLDDATIVIAGDNGTIQKTTNSGSTWNVCSNSSTKQVRNLTFIPGTNTGFAVGATGLVLKTTNTGASWSSLSTGTTSDINSIYCLSDNDIWIAGGFGSILKTSDQGVTFHYVSIGITERLNTVFFTSDNIGYVGGNNGMLLKTMDAGANWSIIPTGLPSSGNYGDINDIYFFDDSTGIAVANSSTILHIYHGGDSITQFSFGYSGSSQKLGVVYFINRDTGFICPTFMNILRTVDGGASWQLMNTTSSLLDYNSVCFTDHHTGYFTASYGGGDETFKKTNDCGVSWTTLGFGWTEFYGMDFITANKGVVSQNSTLKLTIDGGDNWISVFNEIRLNDIKYLDTNKVYGAGTYGGVLQSNNGGLSWSYVNRVTDCNLRRLCYSPSGIGYIVGEHGTILRINDSLLVSDGDHNITNYTKISVFPNPSKGDFNIKFKVLEQSPVKITIYDFFGRSVYEKQYGVLIPGVYEYPVNLNLSSAGIFIVKLDFLKGSATEKMLISQ